jgi:hypothetical protein
MKSTDNGASWTKTVIWPCPYNLWSGGDTTGNFYCVDGASAVALDDNGKAHVLFGLMQANGDEAGAKYWFPGTDGLLYWNEDNPQLPEILDPVWLDENGYVVGWVQDTNVWSAQSTQIAYYYQSMTSMPQITTDHNGRVFAVWTSVTMLTDPDNFLLRHIFTRTADAGGVWGEIDEITDDFLYTWTECAFPSLSPTCQDEYLHIVFQGDDYAGAYVQTPTQGQGSVTDNSMIYLKHFIGDPQGIQDQKGLTEKSVTLDKIFPNPASDRTTIGITVTKPVSLRIEVTSVLGQVVRTVGPGKVQAGSHPFTLDVSGLKSGVYQLTVIAGGERATGKLVKK